MLYSNVSYIMSNEHTVRIKASGSRGRDVTEAKRRKTYIFSVALLLTIYVERLLYNIYTAEK